MCYIIYKEKLRTQKQQPGFSQRFNFAGLIGSSFTEIILTGALITAKIKIRLGKDGESNGNN